MNDRGLAMTSSYSNMVVCGQCLAHTWTLEQYEPILQSLIAAGEKFLDVASECAAGLAEEPSQGFALSARADEGRRNGICAEGIRVECRPNSSPCPSRLLGLRHGPLAALNAETLFVSYISSDSRRRTV